MVWICWAVLVLSVASPFVTIAAIGKPRSPLGRDDAAIAIIVAAAIVAVCCRALGLQWTP